MYLKAKMTAMDNKIPLAPVKRKDDSIITNKLIIIMAVVAICKIWDRKLGLFETIYYQGEFCIPCTIRHNLRGINNLKTK
ncbi:MAG TPA: hypothetical protein VIP29_00700 [Nitrososphaeraceae archaeon]